MSHVIAAPDKFKGSLSAREAAAHVAAGLRAAAPGLDVVELPVADGGDGTLEAALSAGYDRVPVTAGGPTGEPVATAFARRGAVAVVEMADVSGLSRLPGGRLDPLGAGTYGTGQVIRAALDAGVRTIVLGVGGSASTDGGAGLARALGADVRREGGGCVRPGGAGLLDVADVDLRGLHPRIAETEFILACDVDNPLLGPRGAAAVYGPQKGAGPGDVALLDRALARWAERVARATGTDHSAAPGAGAAGGVGFAALALLNAAPRPGIEIVLDLVGYAGLLREAGLVITGEGSLDEQTLSGKAPAGVAAAAARAGVPVAAVAGRTTLGAADLSAAGISRVYTITGLEPDPRRRMTDAGPLLERLAARLAADFGLVTAGGGGA
ncbi:glycerate kinase [Actinomadura sp. 7K507]|uniref:glycerate kinase n=1 Tax=Actinomadura sp. 7K507 TaxID=2530365 RepID=UPI001044458D|nr:glycerate kinase [Actinomadura sp. 7K507]TDC97182.1 glycerate kinase [Actinomadura sp. 7K507]